ncbi:hypothetical protein TRIUR3_35200 [Triticum urartu]|uniref:Uncharacterized protein n=1 Tax=Triticum urartu TaxID=4572 RepID=M7Z3C4_TRIUA|nr:hypothetical protein TRIUR3_35200 [Triticum urartu]
MVSSWAFCCLLNHGINVADEESQKLREKVESMDKEELQEYAKKVTGDLANLRQCNIDRAEMDAVKQDENLHHLTLAEDI